MASSSVESQNPTVLPQEEIVATFNDLRKQQRNIAAKITDLNLEKKEHEAVIEALKECEINRKCFRQIGGVLVERTVKEVLPALVLNSDNLNQVINTLTKQLEDKGSILNEYRDKYGVKLQGEQMKKVESETQETKPSGGVLVS